MERLYEHIKRCSLKAVFSFVTRQKETYIEIEKTLIALFSTQRIERTSLVVEPFEDVVSGLIDDAKLVDMRHAEFADKVEFIFWTATCKMASQ